MNRNHRSQTTAAAAPPQSAEAAGLQYACDDRPGIRRQRSGSGFRYLSPRGRVITDAGTLKRIRALAIPPAWTEVWIAAEPRAHLQATGRDARGRKQYRYHARWRDVRHQTKYERMIPFGHALPLIRNRVATDLREPTLSRTKVAAAVVQLLEKTWFRIGNIEYARSNRSFGLTTLRDRHVRVRGSEVKFEFVGKSGIRHSVTLTDAQLARVVKRCQDLPGQDLFQYVDSDGRRRVVSSADVNTYLREAAGGEFTAKDFRTWAGTLLAARALAGQDLGATERKTKSIIAQSIATVARHLGNTPAVCRACYIHPAVLEAYADGTLRRRLQARRGVRGLNADERALLNLLESRRSFPEQLAEAARLARRQRRPRRSVARVRRGERRA
jgi:DNA topoisomerase-1